MRVTRREPRTAGNLSGLPLAIAGSLAAGCLAAGIARAGEMTPGETPGAIVIELDRAGRAVVREFPAGRPPFSVAGQGVCLWSDEGQDRWQSLGSTKPAATRRKAGLPITTLDDASRAGDAAPEPSLATAMLTGP